MRCFREIVHMDTGGPVQGSNLHIDQLAPMEARVKLLYPMHAKVKLLNLGLSTSRLSTAKITHYQNL